MATQVFSGIKDSEPFLTLGVVSGITATHGLKGGLETLNYEHDIEKRLQAQVLKDRIRIREFFYDFDRLRKGHVGEAGFRSALGTLNI